MVEQFTTITLVVALTYILQIFFYNAVAKMISIKT